MAIGWALVSLGSHAETFFAPAIAGAEGAQLVAVYSRDPRVPKRLRPHMGHTLPTRRWSPSSPMLAWT